MKNRKDILNGSIYKAIITLFLPILLGTFFQQLYNTVDSIIVGKYVGKAALGAVGGTTSTLINLLINFIVGLCSGTTIVVAQFYGKGDRDNVKKSVRTGITLSIILGTIIMVVGILVAPTLLKITNVNNDIYDYALSYMRIYFLGLIPSMIYNASASILRAIGDSKRPLYFLIVSTFVNIIFDVIFVRFLNLDVKGAALATILSQLVSCILALLVLSKSNDCYHFELKDLSIDTSLVKKILGIGLPTGIQSVLYSITNVYIQSSLNSLGTDTVAGYAAACKIDAIFWMYTGAIGNAMMTVAGQNFGANNIERVKEVVKKGTVLHALFTIVISLAALVFGNAMLSLFSDDPEVIRIGYEAVKFLAPHWLTFTIVEVLSDVIKACGDSTRPMIFTLIGICFFRVIWLTFFAKADLISVLICYPISWVITSIILVVYYLSGIWLKICIRKREALLAGSHN